MDFVKITSFSAYAGGVQFFPSGLFYFNFSVDMEIETKAGLEKITEILFCEKEKVINVFVSKKKVASFYDIPSVVW